MGRTLAQVRASIKTTLDGSVPPGGGGNLAAVAKTHDYFRTMGNNATEIQRDALFVKNGVFHAWMVTLGDEDPFLTVNSKGEMGRNPANHEHGRYGFKLYGFYAVNDAAASEKTFQDIVESVVNAFRADKKLGDTVIDSGPLQWRQGGYATLPPGEGGVLCHRAVLDLPVRVQTEP